MLFTAISNSRGGEVLAEPNKVAVIESVQRALILLRILRSGETLSVTAAANALDVSAATAYRLLATLRVEGFAVQLADRRYRRAPEGRRRPAAEMNRVIFNRAIKPVADRLADDVGDTVLVWARDGAVLKLVYGVDGRGADAVPRERFQSLPAYATAAGRVLLAEMPNRELEDLHREGLIPWRESKITSIVALKRRLQVVRRLGFETTFEEAIQGTAGLAIAIHDYWDRPVAALAIAAPLNRIAPRRLDELRSRLDEAGAEAERRLRELPVEPDDDSGDVDSPA